MSAACVCVCMCVFGHTKTQRGNEMTEAKLDQLSGCVSELLHVWPQIKSMATQRWFTFTNVSSNQIHAASCHVGWGGSRGREAICMYTITWLFSLKAALVRRSALPGLKMLALDFQFLFLQPFFSLLYAVGAWVLRPSSLTVEPTVGRARRGEVRRKVGRELAACQTPELPH